MHYIIRAALGVLFAFIVISSASAASTIKEIEVLNNQRVETSTIESYMDISAGDSFDQAKVNSSLKRLFATGLFSDISINMKGGTLVVDVEENPIINKVSFEGNKRIGDESIKSETELKPRSVYTTAKVQRDTKKIEEIYRKSGRFSVAVEPKIIELDQNRIDLIYEIEEGKKATVSKIYFIGNKFYDDDRLKREVNTKESRWYSFYSSDDTYDPDKVAYDKELLRKYYVNHGFFDFKVLSSTAEITKDKKSFILSFTLDEGDRYTFGNSKITTSVEDINVDDLTKEIKTPEGDIFSAKLVEDTIQDITNKLNDKGYAFVEVDARYNKNYKDRSIDIDYQIAEGPKVYIDQINITGNVRTLDKVIRREMRIGEGDPFNAAKIRRSKQRIQNLGFFDKVDVDSQRTDVNDKADIKVKVNEKSTGELSFGAGFSTNDGAIGNVSVRERNLLGRGQDLRLGYQKSSRVGQLDLGFTEPYFMGRDVAAGFDLFNIVNNRQSESSFQSESNGGAVRASYSITEHLRHNIKYSFKTVNVSDVEVGASTFITQQEGSNTTSMVTNTFFYDRRDSSYEPKEGYYIKLEQDFAGLGGDSQFFRHEVSSGYYHPVYSEDVIFNLTGRAGSIFGWGDKNVRIDERFFIGGQSLRGFRNSGIGPRDTVTRDALGGNSYYVATSEVRFPLGLPEELGFTGSVFVDAGSLFDLDGAAGSSIRDDNSIRAATGVGVSWSSPLGPIRIDFAHPFASEDYDRKQSVRFNFGTRF